MSDEGNSGTPGRASGLREFIDRSIAHAQGACTRCARCFDACPMTGYSPVLEQASGGGVVDGVLAMLRGDAPSDAALEWTRLCTQSATCIPACPEGINPMLLLRFARMSALGAFGGPKLMQGKEDPEFFLKILAYARLQLTPDELANLR